jgi:exonuclease III
MDRFLTVKKRNIENPSESLPTNAKITKRDDNFRIVTMNSNSLANRISDKKNHADFKAFIECHLPDIVAIQEVRLPAKTTSSNPKKNDGSRRDRTKIDDRDSKASTDKHLLKNCEAFKDYQMYYSLSDWRYAGTAIALRKNSTEPLWIEYTFKAAEEKSIKHQELQMLNNQASSITPIAAAAENAVLKCTAASEEKEKEKEVEKEKEEEKEEDKGSNEDIKSGAECDYESSTIMDGHYADGRVICMGFPSFDLLATYSPNNGSSDTSFHRRRLWDKDTHLFVERAAKRGRPLVWVGDLNVAHTPADVTHPAFFSQQMRQPDSGNSGQAGICVSIGLDVM